MADERETGEGDAIAASESATAVPDAVPLVVDLDGTLLRTDMLHESALILLRDRPLAVLRIPSWLRHGKAALKQRLATLAAFDPAALPYHEPLLEWLGERRKEGRRLVLCTASDGTIAAAVAAHLGIFDEVIASDGRTNMGGATKAEALARRFGRGGFDYVGDSLADVPVWKEARRGVVVGGAGRSEPAARAVCEIEHVFAPPRAGLSAWRRALRPHQWLKNLLLFVPLVAGHDLGDAPAWLALLVAFASFSLCASSVYITNDLLDLESDRLHPRKRHRPFAAGDLPAWQGVVAAPLLLATGVILGAAVNATFLGWLAGYFLLTCAYSWALKRVLLVDCLTLALLYTLRIVAGAAAAAQAVSFWLLAFSVFLFLSLAFVKRYAELELQQRLGGGKLHGRGYHATDAPLIQALGIAAANASVLVLALYVNSADVVRLYAAPQMLWGAVPVMLFWTSWMWMQAHRGRMHDDPLVFALKDRASLAAGAVFAVVLVAGAVGVPW